MNANLEVLKKDINSSLDRFLKYRRGNKKKAEYVVIASASISAATTLFIGLGSIWDNYVSYYQALALFFSASLTIITAWDGFYNHKRLWLLQADIITRLYDISSDIKHLEASGKPTYESVNELHTRYKAAFREFNEQWKELRAEDSSQPSEEQ